MSKRATPTLSGYSSASPRQCTQGRPRRHWAPRAGGWPARGCRSCRHFAGLRPVAGKMPALPGTSLTGPHPGSAGVPPASGPQARHMAKRATPTLSGFSSARPRQGSQGRPRGIGRLGRGGAGSGMSLLSALCGPSARCGPEARAPRNIAHRATPWERGRPARKRATGPPHEQAGDAHARGLLQRPSSAVHPRPTSTALGASGGGGRLGRVAPVGALRAFGPLRARCPRSQEHRFRGHPLGARASRPQAGHRPATWPSGRRPRSERGASPVPVGPRQSRETSSRPTSTALGASGGGMSPARGCRFAAPCGPSARCGQDARAPRNIASGATPWERGRPARKRATGPPHEQAGDTHALGRPHHSHDHALGGGVGGSGMSLLSALCGPSARCGQDARAPRNIAHRATPWERGRPARKRATGPPHGQAGDTHALGLLQRPSSAVHPRPTSTALGASGGGWPARACRFCRRFAGLRPVAGQRPALPGTSLPRPASTALGASGGGVAGSGVSLLSALCGPSARCGQEARAPRNIAHRATPWERGRPARKRATGPPHGQAGDAHALGRPHHSHDTPWAGELVARAVAPVGALRAFGPLRARCPRSQEHRSQGRPRRHWPPRAGDGSGRLGRVASVGALRAFGPLRARCPRSQEHRFRGHTLGARASRPQAGRRPATWPSGRRPRSRASPAPVLGADHCHPGAPGAVLTRVPRAPPWRAGRRPHQRAPTSSSMPCAGAVSSLCRRVALMPTEKPEGFAAGARRQPRL